MAGRLQRGGGSTRSRIERNDIGSGEDVVLLVGQAGRGIQHFRNLCIGGMRTFLPGAIGDAKGADNALLDLVRVGLLLLEDIWGFRDNDFQGGRMQFGAGIFGGTGSSFGAALSGRAGGSGTKSSEIPFGMVAS